MSPCGPQLGRPQVDKRVSRDLHRLQFMFFTLTDSCTTPCILTLRAVAQPDAQKGSQAAHREQLIVTRHNATLTIVSY